MNNDQIPWNKQSVWDRIETELDKKKKRRVIFFFLTAFILLGLIFYTIYDLKITEHRVADTELNTSKVELDSFDSAFQNDSTFQLLGQSKANNAGFEKEANNSNNYTIPVQSEKKYSTRTLKDKEYVKKSNYSEDILSTPLIYSQQTELETYNEHSKSEYSNSALSAEIISFSSKDSSHLEMQNGIKDSSLILPFIPAMKSLPLSLLQPVDATFIPNFLLEPIPSTQKKVLGQILQFNQFIGIQSVSYSGSSEYIDARNKSERPNFNWSSHIAINYPIWKSLYISAGIHLERLYSIYDYQTIRVSVQPIEIDNAIVYALPDGSFYRERGQGSEIITEKRSIIVNNTLTRLHLPVGLAWMETYRSWIYALHMGSDMRLYQRMNGTLLIADEPIQDAQRLNDYHDSSRLGWRFNTQLQVGYQLTLRWRLMTSFCFASDIVRSKNTMNRAAYQVYQVGIGTQYQIFYK
jgi:hypothetical protein